MSPPIMINLGCGFRKAPAPWVNVDAYWNCKPDILMDIDKTSEWPWKPNSVDCIEASHILEHLSDYWSVVKKCAEILKPNGLMIIRVPDASSTNTLAFRDHKHIITIDSFFGLEGWDRLVNAWAMNEDRVPLKVISYEKVPNPQYNWLAKWFPAIMRFCADHLNNFVHEQIIILQKIQEGSQDA